MGELLYFEDNPRFGVAKTLNLFLVPGITRDPWDNSSFRNRATEFYLSFQLKMHPNVEKATAS